MKIIKGIVEFKFFLLDIKEDIYNPVTLENMIFKFYRNGSIVIEPCNESLIFDFVDMDDSKYVRIYPNWQNVCDIRFEGLNIFKTIKEKYNKRIVEAEFNGKNYLRGMRRNIKIESAKDNYGVELNRPITCFPIEIYGDTLYKLLCEE